MDDATTARVAVVTGAGTGIGRAVAEAFLEAGLRVALVGRRPSPLHEVAGGHSSALVVPGDVSEESEVTRIFAAVDERWGRIDVLFNNAGVLGPSGMVDEISLQDWNDTLAVNVTGTMLCAAEAVRLMKRQSPPGGRIINNGSISAQRPRPRSLAYTVSKHAITGLTRSVALDGRAWGISCGQIDIGNVQTAITQEIGTSAGALQADGSVLIEPTFAVADAARAVLLMAQLPANVSIGSLTITAMGMPFDGRG